MPKVGGRHFPYTPAGYKAAAKARKKAATKPSKKAKKRKGKGK